MNTTLRMFAFVFLLCGLAVGYLYQHSCSIRLARRVADLEKQRQLLAEELEAVDSDVVELSGFARLESLWAEGGRLPAPAGSSAIDGQAVAATSSAADEAAH